MTKRRADIHINGEKKKNPSYIGIGQRVSGFLISESPKVSAAAAIHFRSFNEPHLLGVGEQPAALTASGSGSQGSHQFQIRPPLELLF